MTRPRKRQRLQSIQLVPPVDTSDVVSLNTPSIPDWTRSTNQGEGMDELDVSDIEEVEGNSAPRAGITRTQASTLVDIQELEAGPSAGHHSPTPDGLHPPSSLPVISIAAGSSGPGISSSETRQGPPCHKSSASPVSSLSLMKIINETNISPGTDSSKCKIESSLVDDPEIVQVFSLPPSTKGKGKGKGKSNAILPTLPLITQTAESTNPEPEPLSEYTCPICFFPPSNATLTPCGHVFCGSCLFTTVKITLQRGADMGVPINTGENVPRCPVCRAVIKYWDGRGGGVIGLKIRIRQ